MIIMQLADETRHLAKGGISSPITSVLSDKINHTTVWLTRKVEQRTVMCTHTIDDIAVYYLVHHWIHAFFHNCCASHLSYGNKFIISSASSLKTSALSRSSACTKMQAICLAVMLLNKNRLNACTHTHTKYSTP